MTKTRLLTSVAGGVLGLCVLAGFSTAAQAQVSRIYFAGYLGLSKMGSTDYSESSIPLSGDFEFDNGHAFSGALGIRLSRNMRLEGEYTYNKNPLSDISASGFGTFDAGGDISSKMLFANLYYDFDVPWKVQPFLGAGLGYGWHSAEISQIGGVGLPAVSSDDSNILWNFGGGLRYRPRDDLAFSAGYRYIDGPDLEFGTVEVDYGAHEFRLGLEWDLPVSAY